MIPKTMRNIHMVLLSETDAELQDARRHIETLYELLGEVSSFLQSRADYDMNDAGNYVPCNDEARLLQQISDCGVPL